MRILFTALLLNAIIALNVKSQIQFTPGNTEIVIHPTSVKKAEWNAGYIILKNGATFEGGTHFDPIMENVYLKIGDQIKGYSANLVLEFEFNTEKYLSLPFDENNDGFTKDFFFLVLEQNVNYLLLEKISQISFRRLRMPNDPTLSIAGFTNKESIYLGINETGELHKLDQESKENKKTLKNAYQKGFDVIDEFMKENKYKYKNIDDVIIAIKYFYRQN